MQKINRHKISLMGVWFILFVIAIILSVNLKIQINKTNDKIDKLNLELEQRISQVVTRVIICEGANDVALTNVDFVDDFYYYEKFPLELDTSVDDLFVELDKDLQRYIYDLCQDKNITYETVLAIIWRESRFQTDVVNVNNNKTKDVGLMQINDSAHDWLRQNVREDLDLYNPYDNVLAGISLLEYCIDKTGAEYTGLYAYGTGVSGYYNNINKGITTNKVTDLAYEYVDILKQIKEGSE